MTNRPDIELALDVRSYERVIVLASPDSTYAYPEGWEQYKSVAQVDSNAVVVIDRAEVSRKALVSIAGRYPRLITLAPISVEQEKSMRRTLTALYPFAEVWTISTSFGKVLVAKDAVGTPYDREAVVDQRLS